MTYTLVGELAELTVAIQELRQLAAADGILFDTADFGGTRSEADTAKILKYRDDDYAVYLRNLAAMYPGKAAIPIEQWRPIAPFGSSWHNYGAARDLKIVQRPSSFSDAEALRRLGSYAKQCGLRWGGAFRNKRVDPPHFELAVTLEEARHLWEFRRPTA